MAFVRWRGQGSRFCWRIWDKDMRCPREPESISDHFPQITVDKIAVEKAMAEGPSKGLTMSKESKEYAEVAQVLRQWGTKSVPYPWEASSYAWRQTCLRTGRHVLNRKPV